MDYIPTRPNLQKLETLVWEHFKDVPMPEDHFTSWLPNYRQEFERSNSLNLETATFADIENIYESNTFYRSTGRKYRFPRMFSLVLRLGQKAMFRDFAGAFFGVPTCCDMPKAFQDYSIGQKYCVWLALDGFDLHYGTINLYDHEAKEINDRKNLSLKVVDQQSVEILSENLFGTSIPPMDAIRTFAKDVCD
ncbi:MAG: hypothetical protein KC439_07105 [Yoonia sp.]|nr:hypothetical protein [Yoonia sp.]